MLPGAPAVTASVALVPSNRAPAVGSALKYVSDAACASRLVLLLSAHEITAPVLIAPLRTQYQIETVAPPWAAFRLLQNSPASIQTLPCPLLSTTADTALSMSPVPDAAALSFAMASTAMSPAAPALDVVSEPVDWFAVVEFEVPPSALNAIPFCRATSAVSPPLPPGDTHVIEYWFAVIRPVPVNSADISEREVSGARTLPAPLNVAAIG